MAAVGLESESQRARGRPEGSPARSQRLSKSSRACFSNIPSCFTGGAMVLLLTHPGPCP